MSKLDEFTPKLLIGDLQPLSCAHYKHTTIKLQIPLSAQLQIISRFQASHGATLELCDYRLMGNSFLESGKTTVVRNGENGDVDNQTVICQKGRIHPSRCNDSGWQMQNCRDPGPIAQR